MGGNFNRNILLARANIRKAKGQTAAIIVLVLLSSMMMNLYLEYRYSELRVPLGRFYL